MIRAVVDVNVLIVAVLSPRGAPAEALRAWQVGRFEIVVSPALLTELEEVASRAWLVERLGSAGPALVSLLQATAIVEADPALERVVRRDPDDDYLVALARASGATAIVTGDRHLLELDALRPPALDAASFIALLARLP